LRLVALNLRRPGTLLAGGSRLLLCADAIETVVRVLESEMSKKVDAMAAARRGSGDSAKFGEDIRALKRRRPKMGNRAIAQHLGIGEKAVRLALTRRRMSREHIRRVIKALERSISEQS